MGLFIYYDETDQYQVTESQFIHLQLNRSSVEYILSAKNPDKQKQRMAEMRLLKIALKENYPQVPSSFKIEQTENGKPYLKGEGLPFFSITNKENSVMLAVSDSPVGIDIENIDMKFSDDRLLNMAERFYLPEELPVLQNARNLRETFYRIWTFKESYTKTYDLTLSTAFDKARYLEYRKETAAYRYHDIIFTVFNESGVSGEDEPMIQIPDHVNLKKLTS